MDFAGYGICWECGKNRPLNLYGCCKECWEYSINIREGVKRNGKHRRGNSRE